MNNCWSTITDRKNEILLSISGFLSGVIISLSPWSLISNNIPSIILVSIGLGYVFVRSKWLVVHGMKHRIINGRGNTILFIGITMVNTFALLYNKLIGQQLIHTHPVPSVLFIFLLLIIVALAEFTIIGDFFYVSNRIQVINRNSQINKNPTRILVGWFFILSAIWGLYFYAVFPGLMTLDSFSQWKQAGGQQELSNWFPAFHTLIIRATRAIWDNPASMIIFQILFMAFVITFGMSLFLRKGLPSKPLTIYVIIFAVLPTNGILIVNMQKDIPYAISFIWLELLLMKLIWEPDKFQHSFGNHLALFLALSLTGLFRHNGTFVTYCVVAALLVFSIVQKKYSIVIPAVTSVLAIIMITGPLYKEIIITQTPNVFSRISPFQDIAGVYIRGGELSEETLDMMESVMPYEYWIKRFDPYSSDKYLFPLDDDPNYRDYAVRIEKIPLSTILRNYLDTLIRSPFGIISTRVAATSLIWDLTRPDGLFDYPIIWSPIKMGEWGNEFGITNIEWHPNLVTKVINNAADLLGGRISISYYLINGAAISNAIILLIFYYWIITHKIQNVVILVPYLSSILVLALSIPAQDFRYIWHHNILASLLLLFRTADHKLKLNKG